MTAASWDARYAASDSGWGAAPNRFVEAEVGSLPPGRALDLACGEGRNAAWLASRGWTVTGVDFSAVALAKARIGAPSVEWVCADVALYVPAPAAFDLVVIAYLHLPAPLRATVLARAAAAVAPGGHFLLVAHDLSNLAEGTGGPQDPAVLPVAADVTAHLAGFDVLTAGVVEREVAGADRPARDLLVHAVAVAG